MVHAKFIENVNTSFHIGICINNLYLYPYAIFTSNVYVLFFPIYLGIYEKKKLNDISNYYYYNNGSDINDTHSNTHHNPYYYVVIVMI